MEKSKGVTFAKGNFNRRLKVESKSHHEVHFHSCHGRAPISAKRATMKVVENGWYREDFVPVKGARSSLIFF